jgi:hypothetical protein
LRVVIHPGTDWSVGDVQMHHQHPTHQPDTKVIKKQQSLAR